MPNCPNCGHRLAYFPEGSICPGCAKMFTIKQTVALPGYDALDVMIDCQIYEMLDDLGLLQNGVTQIDITRDGYILTHLGEPD